MLHSAGKLQVSAINSGMAAPAAPAGVQSGTVLVDSQICLFNDLFGWARIAVFTLVDRSPPNQMSGPTAEGMTLV